MIPVNPGNLLKFNTDAAWQRHNQPGQDRVAFGLKTPKERCLPFQLWIPSGASSVSWGLNNPIDPTGAGIIAMDAGELVVANKDTGGSWVTHTGFVDLTNPVDCGFYEAWVTVDGDVYKSEVMHFVEHTEAETLYRIRFTNTKDKENVLYTALSYHQFFYTVRWAWDRPKVDRETQIDVDGNGKKTTLFSRTVSRLRLEVSDVPDYAIEFFASAVDLDGIQFDDFAGNIAVVPMQNLTFDSRQQGVSLNIAIFEFDSVAEAFNGCQSDFLTV